MANTLKFKRGLLVGLPAAAEGEPLFTTDTKDLYIGTSTGNQRFQKYIASGTTSQLLRGDGSLLTMPIVLTSPTNGQVLKYNGTSWVNDSDAGITGSGSAGQVAYFSGATTQTGSNNLFWDATNNRLGIGTNAPAYKLEVISSSGYNLIVGRGASGSYFETFTIAGTRHASFGSESNGDVYLGSRASNPLIFITNGNAVGRFDASGNLGLGVTPSAWGTTNFTRALELSTGSLWAFGGVSSLYLSSNIYYNGSARIYKNTGTASEYAQISGAHIWYSAVSGSAGGTVTLTQPMTLTANGRLLLGTTSEGTQLLQVNGTGYFADSVGIGTTSLTGYNLRVSKNISGATVSYGIVADGEIQSSVSIGTINFWSRPSVAPSTTSTNLFHFRAEQGTFNSSTITNQYGFFVDASLTGATNNFAYGGAIAAGTNRWNLYMNGTAANYLNGNTLIGSTTDSGEKLQVTGTMKVTGASTFGGAMTISLTNASLLVTDGTNNSYFATATSNNGYANGTIAGDAVIRSKSGISFTSNNGTSLALRIASTGAATFSSTAQAAGFITSGGTGYAVINSASTTVTALRPTGGGSSIMSTNSNGLHIAVGTQAAGDLILASNNTERIRLSSNGFFSQLNATNPSASITDSYIQYSADVVAGNAAPHFRTENGAIIKLYQETTAVGNSTISVGGGNAVLDDTEFGGYTLRQVVQALKNQGILA